jgi:hypothetical protein
MNAEDVRERWNVLERRDVWTTILRKPTSSDERNDIKAEVMGSKSPAL